MTALREVVVCAPLRTPVGRMGGVLATVPALELATTVLTALLERTGVDPVAIDGVIAAQGYPTMEAPAIGRVAALDAGFPVTTTGYQLDRRCGSGLQAVLNAAMEVQTGVSDAVVALGVESMSNAPLYTVEGRRGLTGAGLMLHDALSRGRETVGGRRFPTPDGNVGSAELLRAEYGISREAQDAFSLQSHRRAVAAQESGAFDAELVPVEVAGRRGSVTVDRDEHPRADTSLEALGALRAILGRRDPDATVTAGNSSGQNDAAAACIVTTRERSVALRRRPGAGGEPRARARGPRLRRPRRDRAQRGIRGAGARLPRRLGPRRRGPAPEPAGERHLDRAPHRGHRHPHARDPRPRAARPRRRARARDDVHRRRAGARGRVRAGLRAAPAEM